MHVCYLILREPFAIVAYKQWFSYHKPLFGSPLGEQKMNVGLNLKFNKKNEEVPGYTKKVGNEWLYSSAVEQILSEYLER